MLWVWGFFVSLFIYLAAHSETFNFPHPLKTLHFISSLLHLRVAIPIGTAVSSKSGIGSQSSLSLVLPRATSMFP